MKPKFVAAYMDTAWRFAQLSSAQRLKVGAVIVKDNRIISIGYNGTPSGWDNVCEQLVPEVIDPDSRTITPAQLVTKPEVLHAEMNALMKLARSTESGEGATLFVTHSPCVDCSKSIYQAGISTVYVAQPYRCSKGIEFLHACGVEVHELNHENPYASA